jgi:hypothetical protein
VTDVAAIVAAARAAGARVLLDGAQAVQHGPQDVQALGVDFYAFSGHKALPDRRRRALGAGEAAAALPPFLGGGGMIGEVTAERPPGPRRRGASRPARRPSPRPSGWAPRSTGCARLDWAHPRSASARLCAAPDRGLAGASRLAPARAAATGARAPIVSFDIAGLHPHDICQVLDAHHEPRPARRPPLRPAAAGRARRRGLHARQPGALQRRGRHRRAARGRGGGGKDPGMSGARSLYQEAIKQMARPPTATANLKRPRRSNSNNPLCGDRVRMQVALDGGRIAAIAHETGAACCAGRRPRCSAPAPPA